MCGGAVQHSASMFAPHALSDWLPPAAGMNKSPSQLRLYSIASRRRQGFSQLPHLLTCVVVVAQAGRPAVVCQLGLQLWRHRGHPLPRGQVRLVCLLRLLCIITAAGCLGSRQRRQLGAGEQRLVDCLVVPEQAMNESLAQDAIIRLSSKVTRDNVRMTCGLYAAAGPHSDTWQALLGSHHNMHIATGLSTTNLWRTELTRTGAWPARCPSTPVCPAGQPLQGFRHASCGSMSTGHHQQVVAAAVQQ